MNRRLTIAAVLAALALVASACGEQVAQSEELLMAQQEDDRSLEEKVDTDGDGEMSQEEMEAYARVVLAEFSTCMRDNGYPDFTDVVLEDLTEGGGRQAFAGLMQQRGVDFTDPNAIPTLQRCGEDLSDLQTFTPEPSDAEREAQEAAVLEFAGCMRTSGVADWPDPDFASTNNPNGYSAELLSDIDLQSAEVQDAISACQAANGAVDLEADSGDDVDSAEVADQDSADTAPEPAAEADLERTSLSPVIEEDTSDLNVAVVTRRDLVQTRTLDGTLGYGEERPFPTNTTGIVTALPEVGEIVGFGDPLFFVDNEPVLLLEGALPQYRPFRSGMTDGPDVEQLEQNLTALGFVEDLDLTVDTDFTGVTIDAIEQLQEAFVVEETGRLELGRVVFSTTPVRVGAVNVELGQSINATVTVVHVTESDQRIDLALLAEDRALVSDGIGVDVELPDGTTVPGVVTEIAAVATRNVSPQTGAASDPTIAVTVAFDGAPPDGVFDAAPVEVIVTEEVSAGVLTVPVPALIARSGGGHAVELIVDGGTQLVEVELGDFVDDIVEVSGDIREGDSIVMASAG